MVPTRDRISEALAELTGVLSHETCDRAHFDGIHAIDQSDVPGGGDRQIYLAAYLSSIGIPEELLEAAIDRPIPLWSGSSLDLWQRVLDGSIAGLRTLHDAEVRLGIVSNSDGHVEEELIRSKICQLGPGEGVPVQTIIDSGVVGVAKPDPAIFDLALMPLELDPSDVIYVGDSVKYDVRSAQEAGMMPVHFDPFGLSADTDHPHVDRVSDVLRFV